jgi:hypothetical protein
MSTEGPITTALVLVFAAILLLWPAFWNGYPLIFADTGTYLSQAIEHYAGWDRPIFYSLFLFPLHMTVTTWPAIGGQALLVAYLLDLLRRTLLPGTSVWWLLPFAGALAFASPLHGSPPSSCRTCSPASLLLPLRCSSSLPIASRPENAFGWLR